MGGRRQRPSNAPGAHYLADPTLARELVDHARVRRGDLVLDLGAGAGALTIPLTRAGARVLAVERDPALAARLRRRFNRANVTVVERDVLEVPLPRRGYRVVASIPFSLTTPLFGRLLDPPGSQLERAALVIGWGAAKRLSDPVPGSARVVWWRARYDLLIARRIPAKHFSPPPRSDAAVLIAARRAPPVVRPGDQAAFARLLESTLATRSAPVAGALAPIFSKRQLRRLLAELKVDGRMPVGRLDTHQWVAIGAAMVAHVDPARWPRRRPRWWSAQGGRRPRNARRPA